MRLDESTPWYRFHRALNNSTNGIRWNGVDWIPITDHEILRETMEPVPLLPEISDEGYMQLTCVGCIYYFGIRVSGNVLNCAPHPTGPNGIDCIDRA